MGIKVLKLTTGEEIVAGVEDQGSYLSLNRPVKFVMVQTPSGGVGLEMHPFVLLSQEETFEVQKEFIILQCDPVKDVLDAYDRQFSNIELPPEKELIL